MAKQNFAKAVKVELVYEGGYSDHPNDPGGVTLEGIIQRVYDGYRKRKGRPLRPLTAAMRGTPEWILERNEIYKAQFWDACRCDELPDGIDLVVLDCAVNSGPYQAALWLQRALRYNNVDGHIGEGVLMAARAHPDHDQVIADLLARRLGMLKRLKTWDDFGNGWGRRVANVKQIGQAWALGSVGPEPVAAHEQKGDAKGYASDVVQPPVDQSVGTNTGAASGTVAVVVQTAQQKLEPFVGTSDLVTNIYFGLTALAVVLAVGGVAYAWWANRANKNAQAAINGQLTAEIDEATYAGEPAIERQ